MPVTSPGRSARRSGFDHVEGFQYRSANKSIAMNRGASNPPAVTGSITNDNSGIPMIEKPPPKAPFMKEIRNTPEKAIRMVATVSSGIAGIMLLQ
ncbi:hypothetical protein BTHE68_57280 (plasmid) [Burkholderia sp. THE68]|nr:hypothetical protein BTHE68_57280 [Burkholderia sp. THE68]